MNVAGATFLATALRAEEGAMEVVQASDLSDGDERAVQILTNHRLSAT